MIHSTRTIALTLSLFLLPFNLLLAQQWNQLGSDIDGEEAFDNSGKSISMDHSGYSVIIGAPGNGGSFSGAGHARVYEYVGGAWVQKGADLDGEAEYDGSGKSVAMNGDGNTVAVSAVSNSDGGSGAGHVRVYEWSGDAWVQKGDDIDGDANYIESGNAIDLSANGNKIVIAASKSDVAASNAGQVRVYEWAGDAWIQQGASLNGDAANDSFGYSVSMTDNGNTIAIGAPLNSGVNVNGGQLKIFEWSGSVWTQKGTSLYGEDHFDRFGFSVSLNSEGNTVAIGAIMNYNVGADAGHVRVFQWNGSSWEQKGIDIDGEAYDDNSGSAVSLSADGNTVAIGATGNDGTFGTNAVAGHVRVYLWYNEAWAQFGDDIDGEGGSDFSGKSVALSADGIALAVGADGNNGNGTSAGHVRVWAAPEFVSVSDHELSSAIKLYPNPTTGLISIKLDAVHSDVEVTVKNTLGQIVSSTTYSSAQLIQLELDGASGLYFVEVKRQEIQPLVFKVNKR